MCSTRIKKLLFYLFISILLYLVAQSKLHPTIQQTQKEHWHDNIAMIVSVSSDGKYVVTSNLNQQLVLWDIKNKTHKIIAVDANIYSAYFIKHSDNFMWQNDDTNEVYVANVKGKILHEFNPGFPTYGQIITTNLKTYFASDIDWNIYSYKNGNKKLLMRDEAGFLGIGKLINFTLSNGNEILLTSGNGDQCINCLSVKPSPSLAMQVGALESVTSWDVKSDKPLMKFPGNIVLTFATLSPNDKYIISGDSSSIGFIWQTKSGKLKFRLANTFPGHIVALKFIDKIHYLRFNLGVPRAILYSINSPKPLKYIKIAKPMKEADLSKERYPSFSDYTRDEAIDTAPTAHILVMGQQLGNGIIVYKYNPKTQTLKKIWVGNF